ncbi:MAG TPA: aromatic amino acid ammonia-lyase, partial [Candidatus Acidoferrum sp.]|nr:aromatic amino acid ammonia-lyase [Candidatus Acidoferrum sp.]
MTIELTGHDLDRDQLVRVARHGAAVALAPDARAAMDRSHAIAVAALARGDAVYGATSGVGVLKRIDVAVGARAEYASSMLGHHVVGQGPEVPRDVLRATLVRLANHLAEGSPGVRPELADRLLDGLARDELPAVRSIGSVGQGDLAPLATLVLPILEGFPLVAGEGTALLANNSFATAWAALAIDDAAGLLDVLDVAGALSLDGFAANPTLLHPRIGVVRPHPGLRSTLARLGDLLSGSAIHEPGIARNLQDPLSFRNLPQLHGAARDAFAHVDGILAIELNASQGNPIVVPDEDRVASVANFEILPLAAALDYLRIVLASVVGAASERVTKLLYPA